MEIKQIAQYDTKTRKNSNRFRVYDTDGLAPTLGGMGGGGREPWILIIANTPSPFISESNVYDVNGISPTLTARDYKGPKLIEIKSEVSREHKS